MNGSRDDDDLIEDGAPGLAGDETPAEQSEGVGHHAPLLADGETPAGEREDDGHRPALWRRWLEVVRSSGIFDPQEWPLRKLLRRALAIVVAVIALGIARHSVVHVQETEAAVVVHNLSRRMELRDQAGFHILVPYLSRCYKLDKTIQRLDLTWRQTGTGSGRDVKLKTADGSNVSLDVSINYKLIPDQAVEVLRQAGRGMRLAPSWVESAARHVGFSTFGELTTEQIYDAEQRTGKARAALDEMNRRLGPRGIEVISFLPGEFRFHEEYEQVIQEKKLADQQVEERQSQARALLEDQQRKLIEAENEAAVRIAGAEGQAVNRLIDAEAEAEKTKREADGTHAARLRQADTELHRLKNEATGVRAAKLSEAAGLEARRLAMAGTGGLNMVGLEYARRLGSVRFSGTPILRDPALRQFSVRPGEEPGGPAEAAAPAPETAEPMIDFGAILGGDASQAPAPQQEPLPPAPQQEPLPPAPQREPGAPPAGGEATEGDAP